MSAVQNPVHIVTRRITTQDNMITIDYPTVKDMESPTVQHRINRSIIALVDTIMREQGYYKEQKLEMLGWYEIKNNQRGILSLTIGNYSDFGVPDTGHYRPGRTPGNNGRRRLNCLMAVFIFVKDIRNFWQIYM